MDNYNYPIGADIPEAPWNQKKPESKEIEVTVSITLSKTVKIKVDNYTQETEVDEDGIVSDTFDFSECNLINAVKDQITLPNEAYQYILINKAKDTKTYNDLKDWNIDDFEVVLE